jgi:hypothetical protein
MQKKTNHETTKEGKHGKRNFDSSTLFFFAFSLFRVFVILLVAAKPRCEASLTSGVTSRYCLSSKMPSHLGGHHAPLALGIAVGRIITADWLR